MAHTRSVASSAAVASWQWSLGHQATAVTSPRWPASCTGGASGSSSCSRDGRRRHGRHGRRSTLHHQQGSTWQCVPPAAQLPPELIRMHAGGAARQAQQQHACLQPLTSQMCARPSLLPLSTWRPPGLKQALTQKLSVRWPASTATGGASRRDRRYRKWQLSMDDSSSMSPDGTTKRAQWAGRQQQRMWE